jgi:hypothetical protein
MSKIEVIYNSDANHLLASLEPNVPSVDGHYLTELDSDKLVLIKPIPVKLEQIHDDEWIASFDAGGIFFSGGTAQEAFDAFEIELIQAYETLKSLEERGSFLSNQLQVLERYIVKKT